VREEGKTEMQYRITQKFLHEPARSWETLENWAATPMEVLSILAGAFCQLPSEAFLKYRVLEKLTIERVSEEQQEEEVKRPA